MSKVIKYIKNIIGGIKDSWLWSKKWTIISTISVLALLWIAFPFIEKWIIYYNSVKSISNDKNVWMPFVGSFGGSIIGGILSFAGVLASIMYYRRKDIENQIATHMPYICLEIGNSIEGFELDEGGAPTSERFVIGNYDGDQVDGFNCWVKNVGDGPAHNLIVIEALSTSDISKEDNSEDDPFGPYPHSFGVVEKGRKYKKRMALAFQYTNNGSDSDEYRTMEDLNETHYKMKCKFFDSFGNEYRQNIIINLSYEPCGGAWEIESHSERPKLKKLKLH